jgi:hypothetical protein
LQSRLSHSLFCSLNHLRGEIYADYFALFPNFVSSQNDVYPAAATEVHDHLTGLKVRKASRIATTP